jgi:hypothetical protein
VGKLEPVQRTMEEKLEIMHGGSNRGIVSETWGQQGTAQGCFIAGRFLLPNNYSPAQPLTLDCRRDLGRLVAFISHQDR